MDYLLAAHIQVTGGAEAIGTFSQMAVQINNFGTAASKASTGELNNSLGQGAEKATLMSTALDRVGTALVRMATYQGIRLIEDGIRQAAGAIIDFDDQMVQSLAIQSGVTDQMRGNMENLAESIAVSLGMAPDKVAEGFYFLASAGLTAEQQMADLPVVAAYAKAGMIDLSKATEQLFDALTALGLKSADPATQLANLTHLSDLLTEAAIKSQGTVSDFGTALSNKAGGMMKAFNIDLEEGVAMLEVFADRGIKGAKGGEAFNQLIRDMALKATQHADAFHKMGIEVFDSSGNFNSLVTIMSQVDKAFVGLSDSERVEALHQLGFTQRNMTLIQGLIGTSGALIGFKADLENAGGVTQRVAENQMESLRSKLDQLKSITMVFAIEGFEGMQQAAAWLVDTFTPAVNAVVDVLSLLAQGAKPVATAFGGMVATAVVSGLQGIADAMTAVFSVMAEHEGVVEALGFALAALGGAAILSSIIQLGVGLAETIGLKALYAQDAVNMLIIKISTMSALEGPLSVVRAGLSGIINILASPLVAAAGIVLLITGIVQAFESGRDKAREFAKELERKYDTSTLQGTSDAASDAAAHLDMLRAGFKKFQDDDLVHKVFNVIGTELDAITPGFFHFNNNLADMRGELSQAEQEANRFKAAQQNISDGFTTIQQSFLGVGANAFTFDPMTEQLMGIAREAKAAGINVDTSSGSLQRLAAANNIDLTAPWTEWAPALATAAAHLQEVRGVAETMGPTAAGTGAAMSPMEEAISTIGDAAASAEEKLKALKTVMDGLSGGAQNQFDMTTKFQAALAGLSATVTGVEATFDSATEAGRKQRDALSDAATAARDLALAHAETSGNMQAGATELSSYAAGIENILRSAKVAEPQIRELLTQMGLTPEQINTLFKLTVDPPAPEVKAGIDDAAGPRDVPIVPNVPPEAKATTIGDLEAIGGLGYNAPISAFAEAGAVAATNGDLGLLSGTYRQADITAKDQNTGPVDSVLNNAARFRWSTAHQVNENDGSVNWLFDTSARWRSSTAHQTAETGSAEGDLTNTARDRWSTIHVIVQQSGTVYAGPEGTGIAEGGIVHAFASGGFENHVAQIGRLGHSRIWNEPETGGEAYIPLSMGKRERSMAIWEETGKLLGASGTSRNVNMQAPITVNVSGAGDPDAVAALVTSQVKSGVDQALSRVLIELASV